MTTPELEKQVKDKFESFVLRRMPHEYGGTDYFKYKEFFLQEYSLQQEKIDKLSLKEESGDFTTFESWWSKNWGRNIQKNSNLVNACRYAFTDGVASKLKELEEKDKKIEKLQNCNGFHHDEWQRVEQENKQLREALNHATSIILNTFEADEDYNFIDSEEATQAKEIRQRFKLDEVKNESST